MFRFLKSTSRTVVHEEEEEKEEEKQKTSDDHGGGGCMTSLTVWTKSLVISCNGFTVIDSNGNLVYRVDNYSARPEEVTLMDASGKPVHTMRRRKTPILVDSWHVYEGEAGEHCRASKSSEKPIFSIRKQVMMNYSLHEKPNNVLARVFRGSKNKSYAYVVEGSYAARSCKVVLDGSRRVVAEIRRKEASKGGVSFGPEVFVLVVHPGFAPGFAMALVVILDQMYG